MSAPRSEPIRPSDERAGGVAAGTQLATGPTHHHPVLGAMTHLVNPVIAKLAGKQHVRAYALIEHRGRRSGRVYTTPVAAQRIADGFMVPMAFGEQADWFRNVQAAGECVIRWNGVAYHVFEPELVDWPTARQAFGPVERLLAPLFARQFVRLRQAPSGRSSVENRPSTCRFPVRRG
jgi:deazaflavin-dependent oxidoreductase (nitroreductase family)